MSHIVIPSENVRSHVIDSRGEWGCVSAGIPSLQEIHILNGKEDVSHRECRCASPGMPICLNGNEDAPQREWERDTPGMYILTETTYPVYPHCECT